MSAGLRLELKDNMKPRVFIGSSVKSKNIAYALQQELRFEATVKVWTQGVFEAGSTALDDLIKSSDEFDFGVFVFEPEDKATIKGKKVLSVRDNVLFELGLFLGKLGKERNFFLVRSESGSPHVATDLQGVTPLDFQPPESPDDLQAALGPAANQIRMRIEKLGTVNRQKDNAGKVVFDSSKGSAADDVVGSGERIYKGEKPVTPRAKGRLSVTNKCVLTVQRTDNEGRFELNLGDEPVIKPRKLRVTFEAQIDGGQHTLNLVLKDPKTKKWSDNKKVELDGTDWTPINVILKTPPIFFRIDDQDVTVPKGKLQIRNLVITDLN